MCNRLRELLKRFDTIFSWHLNTVSFYLCGRVTTSLLMSFRGVFNYKMHHTTSEKTRCSRDIAAVNSKRWLWAPLHPTHPHPAKNKQTHNNKQQQWRNTHKWQTICLIHRLAVWRLIIATESGTKLSLSKSVGRLLVYERHGARRGTVWDQGARRTLVHDHSVRH